jgi:predicted lipoprotein
MKLRSKERVIVLAAFFVPACVIVSSTSRPGPRPDAAMDAPPQMDAPIDPLARAEATRMLLANVPALVLPTYRELAMRLDALETATAAYATSGTDADRDAARAVWRSAMETVERAELFQFGPAGMPPTDEMEGALGGLGLRTDIYSWAPAFPNRCRIDVNTARAAYADEAALAAQPPFVRTLSAMEYLLFEPTTAHHCLPGAAITVDDATWNALGEAEIRTRRAAYARALAVLASQAADALVAAWEPTGGDFAGQIALAGQGSTVYPTTQEALNAVFDGLFFLDVVLKDRKLGGPSGRADLCSATSGCPELLESQWAGVSVEHLRVNLIAFRDLFTGASAGLEGPGFDDLLRAVGRADLAASMIAAIDEAIRVVDGLPPIDATSFDANRDALAAAYDAVRGVTTPLKTELITILDLELPMGADGDND